MTPNRTERRKLRRSGEIDRARMEHADDALRDNERWFHGGFGGLERGDELRPAPERAPFVYFSRSGLLVPFLKAQMVPNGAVYEVRAELPIDRVTADF